MGDGIARGNNNACQGWRVAPWQTGLLSFGVNSHRVKRARSRWLERVRYGEPIEPLIALFEFTRPPQCAVHTASPRHYYESHDRDTPLRSAAYPDPLITFHLSPGPRAPFMHARHH
ncbi:hypothetical protein QLX08_005958 [Tetragonisca angustula]|uniref:Uncharacterized protein n=1 Tax=Tetragonisca angustula TaxID=166442 RepID=A0AAW0ZW99_9HYME